MKFSTAVLLLTWSQKVLGHSHHVHHEDAIIVGAKILQVQDSESKNLVQDINDTQFNNVKQVKHHQHQSHSLNKRGQCQFPSDAGLVAITPDQANAGWAMSPDETCTPGSYCPYACPAGQLSAQWDPSADSYTYPQSMNGGLYCDDDGQIQKPFPDKPYCYDGVGSVSVTNKCGSQVAFCQTVLPGNEAMLIPTVVSSGNIEVIAVPDQSYWVSTSAHYYINPPGIDADTGCVWGTSANPYGNWAPYVAGANADGTGNSYVKIAWNPEYLDSSLQSSLPSFGLSVTCSDDNCVGLPCTIDPSVDGPSDNFCVVTVPSGSSAYIEVFTAGSNDVATTDDEVKVAAAGKAKVVENKDDSVTTITVTKTSIETQFSTLPPSTHTITVDSVSISSATTLVVSTRDNSASTKSESSKPSTFAVSSVSTKIVSSRTALINVASSAASSAVSAAASTPVIASNDSNNSTTTNTTVSVSSVPAPVSTANSATGIVASTSLAFVAVALSFAAFL